MADEGLRAYLDSSAIVKLVVEDEPESGALRASIESMRALVSSELSAVEVIRAVRKRADHLEPLARDVLSSAALHPVSTSVIEAAAMAAPATLRSGDAIQLATALSLDHVDVFISYDERLNEAAAAAGLTVESPA